MMPAPAVELRGISKRFGGVLANDCVSLSILKGEIHGLIGENGAGKSTVMRILYGFYRADSGEILIHGNPAAIRNPEDAIELGIGMVHQHFMLVEPLTVLENVILGREPKKFRATDFKKAREEIGELLRNFHVGLDLDARIENLPVGMQQQVEILKLLYRKADILILDEPTAVLTPQETDTLFSVLRNLRAQGKTVIIITHKMSEILALTDRVTVLRDGKKVGEIETSLATRKELAKMMVGRDIASAPEKKSLRPGAPVLQVENLCVRGGRGQNAIEDLCFEVHENEIVGIAGVMGNGQTELEEALTGLRRTESGHIKLFGNRIENLSVSEIRRHGVRHMPERQPVGHVPEDRHQMGLILPWNVEDNFLLGQHDLPQFRRGPFLKRKEIGKNARHLIQAYDIRPSDQKLPAGALSGGNQQKIILARELDPVPKFAVVAQPTRGVDIGAIEFIHKRIAELREKGTAILLISADLEEIFALADRIVVLYHGKKMGEMRREDVNEQTIGLMMMGSQAA